MKSEFEIAITQLAADRNLEPRVILEAIEMALVSAYKRNYGSSQNVSVTLDPRTGQAQVYVKKLVTDNVEDDSNEITLDAARQVDHGAKLGDYVDIEVKPRNFGRIAAQTAKQVITQRIREAERDSVYAEYAEREGELLNGTIRNVDARSNNVVVSLGKAEAILPRSEQIPREHYRFGQRIRVYIVSVERSVRGPQIMVSRTHPELLKRLLELEVPEIYAGTVEVKAIAREPGFRSKVAVAALQPGVDPVGSCVGMRGVRIQNIVNELVGEKIDVVEWSKDERVFIANALSPARVVDVYLNNADKSAQVVVPDRALSLAIGKEGQNARLAARLTGWRIDIKSETEAEQESERLAQEREEAEARSRERQEARVAAAALLAEAEALLGDADDAVASESALAEPAELQEPAPVNAEPLETPNVPTPEELAREVAEATSLVEEKPEAVAEQAAAEAADAEQVEAEAVSEAEPEEIPSGDQASADQESGAEEALEEPADGAADDFAADIDLSGLSEADEDEQESDRSRERSKSRRDRRLEFDEQLGRVVSRKQHKRRGRDSWGDDWD